MIWHLQVLGVPQALISGPTSSRLLESALFSPRQEPVKISLFDPLLGNILPTGKLWCWGRWENLVKIPQFRLPWKWEALSYHHMVCFSLQSSIRSKCPILGNQGRDVIFILKMKKSNPCEIKRIYLPMVTQLLCGKGKSPNPMVFLILVCSQSPG